MVPCISHRSHLIEVILGIYTITMLSKFISGTHSLYPLSGDQLDHSLVFSLWRRGQWEPLIQPFLCSGPRVWKIKGYIRCCWLFLLPHLSGSVLFFCFLVLKVIVFEESHFPAGSFVKLGLASHTDLRFSHRLPVEILTLSVHWSTFLLQEQYYFLLSWLFFFPSSDSFFCCCCLFVGEASKQPSYPEVCLIF